MYKISSKVKVQVEFNYMYFPSTLEKIFHLSDDVIKVRETPYKF